MNSIWKIIIVIIIIIVIVFGANSNKTSRCSFSYSSRIPAFQLRRLYTETPWLMVWISACSSIETHFHLLSFGRKRRHMRTALAMWFATERNCMWHKQCSTRVSELEREVLNSSLNYSAVLSVRGDIMMFLYGIYLCYYHGRELFVPLLGGR